jgi:hypothetical protein
VRGGGANTLSSAAVHAWARPLEAAPASRRQGMGTGKGRALRTWKNERVGGAGEEVMVWKPETCQLCLVRRVILCPTTACRRVCRARISFPRRLLIRKSWVRVPHGSLLPIEAQSALKLVVRSTIVAVLGALDEPGVQSNRAHSVKFSTFSVCDAGNGGGDSDCDKTVPIVADAG